MMINHSFELTAEPVNGYSGGLWLNDGDIGHIDLVDANIHRDSRRYVIVSWRNFWMVLDRDDTFECLIKQKAPAKDFYEYAFSKLMPTLTVAKFLKILTQEHDRGFVAGVEQTQKDICKALGIR